ncbi:MAG: copper amine oxidase N-terminal domain-containing protein [Clostridia bacterium]|nr:copper amine oxidase N-terminal domain-containing protein [Clostridia bacterium]
MKRFLAVVLSLCMLVSLAPAAFAQEDITVSVNGTNVVFDVPPQIIGDRTMVPMRAIFETLGCEVTWNGADRSILATRGDERVAMQIENTVMTGPNGAITLDVPPQIVDDRTLVPVRAISESLGCDVAWDGENRHVTVSGNEEKTRTSIGVARGYCNAFCAFDFEKMASFVNGGEKLDLEAEMTKGVEIALDAVPMLAPYKAELTELVKAILPALAKYMSYEIVDVQPGNGTDSYSILVHGKDMQSDFAISDADMAAITAAAMADPAVLSAALSGDEAKLVEAALPYILDYIAENVDSILENMPDATSEETLVVELVDGVWYVTEGSDLNMVPDFMEIK